MMRIHKIVAVAAAAALAACGGGDTPGQPWPSAGQVAAAGAAPLVTHYAAARFAEQASFGPTPELVAQIRAQGFERWIDQQMALPLAPIDPAVAEEAYAYTFADRLPDRIWRSADVEMIGKSLAAADQLRWRVMWSLSQFVVAGRTKGEAPGAIHWMNLLYRHAFGRYGELLREASINPHMGHYLDNDQNRPKSAECQHCAPNENYARELMQLFSIGVFKLNPDGTPQRDARGRFIETYTQRDVEELARVLTGWRHDPVPESRPPRNWGNWAKPMVPTTWPPERDAGRKVVMGQVFAAGQTQDKDLDDAIALLISHPNVAPFVSLRLIQHLVKSDPSPAYIERVGARFRDNGSGVAGDLRAVVKAILLDPEARRGDKPATERAEDGKFREPWLHRMGLLRGLGCRQNLRNARGEPWILWNQEALRPESVFGFYAPTDRAPGSNLLAPEQRLLNANELTTRLGETQWLRWNPVTQSSDMSMYASGGCRTDEFVRAYATSPRAFIDLLAERWFRGAMPPTLRSNLEQLIRQPQWNTTDPSEGTMRMIGYALSTPYYGVIK
jgi:uncharacterized protein (DUF1800 family)